MKRGRASLVVVATAAWIACAGTACAPTDVTLAILPIEQEAGPPLRCETSLDCASNLYCDKATCDALSGTCELPPAYCDDDEDPFCGYDGITYFDDCLRKASGIVCSSQGACPLNAAVTCAGPADRMCPNGYDCGQLQKLEPAVCAANAEGICWLVPAQCPSPGVNLWDSCLQEGPHCVDTCTALHDGGAYLRSSTCHPRDD